MGQNTKKTPNSESRAEDKEPGQNKTEVVPRTQGVGDGLQGQRGRGGHQKRDSVQADQGQWTALSFARWHCSHVSVTLMFHCLWGSAVHLKLWDWPVFPSSLSAL